MYQLADLAMGGRVAQVVVSAHNDACFGAGSDHFPCVDEVEGKRLLAQHIGKGYEPVQRGTIRNDISSCVSM
jgi:hypothetical protein